MSIKIYTDMESCIMCDRMVPSFCSVKPFTLRVQVVRDPMEASYPALKPPTLSRFKVGRVKGRRFSLAGGVRWSGGGTCADISLGFAEGRVGEVLDRGTWSMVFKSGGVGVVCGTWWIR